MQACDRAGNFRAIILEYGLKEMDSGAVAVSLHVKLTELFDNGEWHEWEQFDMECFGDVWIIKKDGAINEKASESLMRHAGWDGNIDSIVSEAWKPMPCQVVVNKEEYQGRTSFKVAFINDYSRTPGQMSNVTPDKARELQNRFGSQLRALVGNVKRNQPTPPNGRPAAPPPPAASVPHPASARAEAGDIPF
jgi:hypothetical protein